MPIDRCLLLLFALALAGCSGPSGPTCYPVRGQVLVDGKPVAEAQVVFHPLDAPAASAPRTTIPKPLGFTDSEGRFTLTTLRTNDGAPAGSYSITIELRSPRKVGEELVRDGANLLPARYGAAKTSGQTYQVLPRDNEVSPLRLQGK